MNDPTDTWAAEPKKVDTPANQFNIGKTLKPEILMHSNIPKPLHEVNPRNIMGKFKWDKVRQEVYKAAGYCCVACGVEKALAKGHPWLEAHEFYRVDYIRGKVYIESLEALCHYCHNFIHSGRLSMIMGEQKEREEVIEILEHGFKILADAGLKANPVAVRLADEVGANKFGVKAYEMVISNVPWGDWRLVWEGKEYSPKYPTQEAWREHFNR